jgi:hypothetical protein
MYLLPPHGRCDQSTGDVYISLYGVGMFIPPRHLILLFVDVTGRQGMFSPPRHLIKEISSIDIFLRRFKINNSLMSWAFLKTQK